MTGATAFFLILIWFVPGTFTLGFYLLGWPVCTLVSGVVTLVMVVWSLRIGWGFTYDH